MRNTRIIFRFVVIKNLDKVYDMVYDNKNKVYDMVYDKERL